MVLILGNGFVANHVKELFDNYKIVSKKEFENIEEIIKTYKPEIIINTIGILKETKNNSYEKAHIESVKKVIDSIDYPLKKFIHFSALGVEEGSSRYFITKREAEELIKQSGFDYLILRPSIILGEGQQLYKDLKSLSFLPFLVAPKGKVAPVDISKVLQTIKENLNSNSKIIEICGEEKSYKELFESALKELQIDKKVIEVDRFFLLPMAIIGSLFKFLPLDLEQWKMLEKDNICVN